MDLLTLMILNSFCYWAIVLGDQVLQPPMAKSFKIAVAFVALVIIAIFCGPSIVRR